MIDMKKKSFFLLAAMMFASCQNAKEANINIDSIASPKGTELFQPDWDNIAQNYQFPEWFSDAKFGIFIHWGVYSVPAYAGEWYARNMYQMDSREYKHHIETYGEHTAFGYKDFIPMFKAEKFNADEWAKLFRESGAKYVVPVAEHHDGFAMYDSDLNEWNSVKMEPGKDIVGLLKKAVEREGLVFGLSTHRAENAWFYNGGMRFPSDVQDTTITLYGRRFPGQSYDESWAREWLAHTYELVNKYQPELIWFDWTVHNPVLMPYFNRFLAYYYNNALDWGKQVVVNTKQGYPTNIQVWDVERGKSDKMMLFPWQTDTSIGKRSWGYIDGEENKTAEQIVHDLIDIVSKNGCLLLNIGPRADGTITEEQQAVLLDIGKWLKVNGEAIYGTRCWKKLGEGDAKSTKGSFTDNTATIYTARDMRFTTKGNDFFVIVLNWDDAGVIVKSLDKEAIADAQIQHVQLLGSNEKIEWQQTDKGLKLSFPKIKPCEFAYSFKISFDKKVGEHLPSEAIDEVMRHGEPES
jgi:alpha-L-fucosidase